MQVRVWRTEVCGSLDSPVPIPVFDVPVVIISSAIAYQASYAGIPFPPACSKFNFNSRSNICSSGKSTGQP